MQNKSKHATKTCHPTKTINLGHTIEQPSASTLFRKPKKVIKLLHLKTEAYLGRKDIIEEMKYWADECRESLEVK
jgi:hypothetical protein